MTEVVEHGTRTILHVDMDAFYASVELRRHPDLAGRPVVVGGGAERGVVAAASYEARRHGIRSAMSGAEARRRCPDVVFLPPDHGHYAEVSAQIRHLFEEVTPLVEPLALDEAFLDVSGATKRRGSGAEIAEGIRSAIRAELDLGCSVGVATNKFIAKLASVDAKPIPTAVGVENGRGVVVVPPGAEAGYVAGLGVARLWGVGPKMAERLARVGVTTVAELLAADRRVVAAAVGETATQHLLQLAVGRDERQVVPDRQAKSIGHEETFGSDISAPELLDSELVRMADLVAARVRRSVAGARTWTIKIRFDDFSTVTRSNTWTAAVDSGLVVAGHFRPVLAALMTGRRVRLLGVSASQFDQPAEQLELFSDSGRSPDRASRRQADQAVDRIRERFGDRSIGPGSSFGGR